MRLRNSNSPLYRLLSVAVGSQEIGCATGSDAIDGDLESHIRKGLALPQNLEQTAPIVYQFSNVCLGELMSKGDVLVLIA